MHTQFTHTILFKIRYRRVVAVTPHPLTSAAFLIPFADIHPRRRGDIVRGQWKAPVNVIVWRFNKFCICKRQRPEAGTFWDENRAFGGQFSNNQNAHLSSARLSSAASLCQSVIFWRSRKVIKVGGPRRKKKRCRWWWWIEIDFSQKLMTQFKVIYWTTVQSLSIDEVWNKKRLMDDEGMQQLKSLQNNKRVFSDMTINRTKISRD